MTAAAEGVLRGNEEQGSKRDVSSPNTSRLSLNFN